MQILSLGLLGKHIEKYILTFSVFIERGLILMQMNFFFPEVERHNQMNTRGWHDCNILIVSIAAQRWLTIAMCWRLHIARKRKSISFTNFFLNFKTKIWLNFQLQTLIHDQGDIWWAQSLQIEAAGDTFCVANHFTSVIVLSRWPRHCAVQTGRSSANQS